MSFRLKRCIQACQFSPISVRIVFKRTHTHTLPPCVWCLGGLIWHEAPPPTPRSNHHTTTAQHGLAQHVATVSQRCLTLQLPALALCFSLASSFSLISSVIFKSSQSHVSPFDRSEEKKIVKGLLELKRTATWDTGGGKNKLKSSTQQWRNFFFFFYAWGEAGSAWWT